MEEDEIITTGKIYIDKKGAGHIYIKKKVIDACNFESGEEVQIKAYPKENVLLITKVSGRSKEARAWIPISEEEYKRLLKEAIINILREEGKI